jgi:hypothetical protein
MEILNIAVLPALFVSRAGEHWQPGILRKAWIAGGKLAEIKDCAAVGTDHLDVGALGA